MCSMYIKSNWKWLIGGCLGDNDQGCEGVVRPAPEGAGRMMQSKPERSDVIIRPAPEGAGRTTPEQPGHYPHYNTKLTVSREIAQIQYQNRLLLLRRAAILFTFLLPSRKWTHPLRAEICISYSVIRLQNYKLPCWAMLKLHKTRFGCIV